MFLGVCGDIRRCLKSQRGQFFVVNAWEKACEGIHVLMKITGHEVPGWLGW